MFHRLVSHNDDLRRLVEKGYAVAFEPGYLIVRDIPYLDDQKQLKIGAIVAKLVAVDGDRMRQDDHQIFFAGTAPCNIDGTPIRNLGGGPTPLPLSEASKDVVVQRSFSNKPPSGAFRDFFDNIESYVGIISGPAIELHGVNPLTFRTVETMPGSVFKFHDTLTSRAEITDLSARFANDVVAVIGLGGTGAYILDFLVKTHVREIRGFDFDWFHVHNAFRSPGRLEAGELGKTKAEIYQARYNNFREELRIECRAITSSSEQDLDGVTFAFVCVDKGSARSAIIDLLIRMRIPFIDVGMGLNRKRGPLNGMVRVTYFSAEHGEQVRKMGLVETSDAPDEEYRKNIQLSELNALNASLAMIKFKQLRGFYGEEHPDYQRLMDIGRCSVVGEWQLE
jgi:hypothetical protein